MALSMKFNWLQQEFKYCISSNKCLQGLFILEVLGGGAYCSVALKKGDPLILK